MQWLNKIADDVIAKNPTGEVIIESGISPSGGYHMGYLREIITCDAIKLEVERRGRKTKHIHFVDDLDGFRKVPAGIPADYEQYLGKPLCDIPAPDGSDQSYADYALGGFLQSVKQLGIEMDVIRSHEKYRSGFFTQAIEKSLDNLPKVRQILEKVSGRKLGEDWSPIQINEDGYLKKRRFLGIDKKTKIISYEDVHTRSQEISYASGGVKLDWRLDWPARWWLMKVDAEPFGRDHGTKGGSYDTGTALVKQIFDADPPIPVFYNFINRSGETKKMSASKGNGILMSEVVSVLPAEVIRYFVLRYAPDKQLFFDPQDGVIRLIDEFAEEMAKDPDSQLMQICRRGLKPTVTTVPFSHLVSSYQAALKDVDATIDIIKRTEHAYEADQNIEILKDELKYIDNWLDKWAPEDVKFELQDKVDSSSFSDQEKSFMAKLAAKIEEAPEDADGEWFHKAIYDLKDELGMQPKEMFQTLYKALIGKQSGPRAGWFLSILPRDWLVKRLKLEA